MAGGRRPFDFAQGGQATSVAGKAVGDGQPGGDGCGQKDPPPELAYSISHLIISGASRECPFDFAPLGKLGIYASLRQGERVAPRPDGVSGSAGFRLAGCGEKAGKPQVGSGEARERMLGSLVPKLREAARGLPKNSMRTQLKKGIQPAHTSGRQKRMRAVAWNEAKKKQSIIPAPDRGRPIFASREYTVFERK